jgi:hypothetical protein
MDTTHMTATQLTSPAAVMHQQDARAVTRGAIFILLALIAVIAIILAGASLTCSTLEASRLISLPMALLIGGLLHAQIALASHLLTHGRHVPQARREQGIGLFLLALAVTVLTLIATARVSILMDRGSGLMAAICLSAGLLVLECSLAFGAGYLFACALLTLEEARDDEQFSRQLHLSLVSHEADRRQTWQNVYVGLDRRILDLRQQVRETLDVTRDTAEIQLRLLERRRHKMETYAPVPLPVNTLIDQTTAGESPFYIVSKNDGHVRAERHAP